MAAVVVQFALECKRGAADKIYVHPSFADQTSDGLLLNESKGLLVAQTTIPPASFPSSITYRYSLVNEQGKIEGPKREFVFGENSACLVKFLDRWDLKGDTAFSSVFSSSLVRDVLGLTLPSAEEKPTETVQSKTSSKGARTRVHLQVYMPLIASVLQRRKVLLTGSADFIGKWDPKKALPLSFKPKEDMWAIIFDLADSDLPFQYKYLLVGEDEGSDVTWEPEGNHVLNGPEKDLAAGVKELKVSEVSKAAKEELEVTKSTKILLQTDGFHEWARFAWRATGVAIPVAGLRSQRSVAVGEFPDLKLLVDWAADSGINLIQVLPINDTTNWKDWHDSSPYSAISSFALHPIYVNLQSMGNPSDALIKEIYDMKNRLEKPRLDYAGAFHSKLALAKKVFSEQKETAVQDPKLVAFVEENKKWLMPYAAFSVLRDSNKTCDFFKWGDDDVTPTLERVYEIATDGTLPSEDVNFYYFLQFHLHEQLLDAATYAKSRRIGLKGDLPIGVGKFCSDTWIYRDNFHMDVSAGAPADGGNAWGQNWGLPTYNWAHMKDDGYSWWRERMQLMAQYFSAFRIDHVLGFFRIYGVDAAYLRGVMGRFRPAKPILKAELVKAGISDVARLTDVYVRRQHINDFAGEKGNDIIARFFEPVGGDRLKLKEWFNTEAKIDASLNDVPEHWPFQWAREDLFRVADSVILLKDPEVEDAYHPRMNIQNSKSFEELPRDWKPIIEKLVDEYLWKRQDSVWEAQGREILPMMKDASNMMACAEDLGMIPHCVPHALQELDILGLRIQRFPTEFGEEFAAPGRYPYGSVCSTSTHDTSPLRLWWEQMESSQRQRFYNTYLKCQGGAPQFCEPWIAEKVIQEHLSSTAMWAVFPIQDLMACRSDTRRPGHPRDEMINMPDGGSGDAAMQGLWSYRIHLNLEDLVANKPFSSYLRGLIKAGGRLHE